MKRNLYIFDEVSPAGNYGIGTYIAQVKECFSSVEDISVYVIQLCSKEEECLFDPESNTLHIPRGLRYSSDKRNLYFRGVVHLLKLHLYSTDNNIFLFNYFSHSELIDMIKEYFSNCKIFFCVHYMEWTFFVKGNTNFFRNILKYSLCEQKTLLEKQVYESYLHEKETLKKTDHVICLSNYSKNILTDNYGINDKNLTVVYNGLKDESGVPKATNGDLRTCFGLPIREKIILYVGRLHKDKGGRELIKAFRLILDEIPNCRLIVVGNGDMDLYLKESNNIWGKVTYTGKIDKTQVYKFYKMADVGILPSFSEQCSYVAIEMMMFGLPIVGTTSTGLSEMIEEGVTGYKVKIEKTETELILPEKTLAKKTIQMLNNPNIQEIRRKSRQRFVNNYSINEMREKLLNTITIKYQ